MGRLKIPIPECSWHRKHGDKEGDGAGRSECGERSTDDGGEGGGSCGNVGGGASYARRSRGRQRHVRGSCMDEC